MSYEGQEIISNDCKEILENLRDDLFAFARIKSKEYEKRVDVYDLQDLCSQIYRSFFAPNFDEKELDDLIEKNFSDKIFAKYFLNAILLHLNINFANSVIKMYPDMIKAILYFNNATQMILKGSKFALNGVNLDSLEQKAQSKINAFSSNMSSGFSIFENVIDNLKRVKNGVNSLHFLNLYNGVKIECDGCILKIEDEMVVCKVELLQILAMKEEDSAYILQDKNIPQHIKADIISINIQNSSVTLGHLKRQKNMPAKDRKYPRVHPNRLTRVVLENANGLSLEGKLYDISEGGMGVVSSLENIGFKNGENIVAKFSLFMPKSDEKFDLSLELKLVVALNYQGSMRYCLQAVNQNQTGVDKLINFARLREQETLKELEDKLSLYK